MGLSGLTADGYVWIDSLCIIQDSKEDWASELDKVIHGAPVDTTDNVLRIGGASWNDLSRLGQRQLEVLDADLEDYSKWLLDAFLELMDTQHTAAPQLRKMGSARMKSLLTDKHVVYDDLSGRATDLRDSDEFIEVYFDTHAAPQARIRALLDEEMYVANTGEKAGLHSCITAIWTLEELMVWRGKWTM